MPDAGILLLCTGEKRSRPIRTAHISPWLYYYNTSAVAMTMILSDTARVTAYEKAIALSDTAGVSRHVPVTVRLLV